MYYTFTRLIPTMQMFRSITLVLSLWFLSGCSQPSNDFTATCRSDVWASSNTAMTYACVIRFDDQILLQQIDGQYSLISHMGVNVCAAHKGLFISTGWNAKLVNLGQITPSQIQLLACSLDNVINTNQFPRTSTSGLELVLLDPFTLTLNDFHHPDDLVAIKNTFLQTPSSKSIRTNSD